MILKYISFGNAPVNEEKVQIESERAIEKSIRSCSNFIRLINERFYPVRESLGMLTDGRVNVMKVRRQPSPIGIVFEVEYCYDAESRVSSDFAFFIADNLPLRWTDKECLTVGDYRQWQNDRYREGINAGASAIY